MATVPIVTASDGPRVVVNDLVKNPKVVPQRMISLLSNQFIADAVLRNAGGNDSGVVKFWSSTPLFADDGSSERTEGGEYRIVNTSMGIPSVAASVDRGLSILITDEMRRRNSIDRVNIQMTQ